MHFPREAEGPGAVRERGGEGRPSPCPPRRRCSRDRRWRGAPARIMKNNNEDCMTFPSIDGILSQQTV